MMPDPCINIRISRHISDLSVVVLMDLSESTNEKIGDISEGDEDYADAPSILSLTREATGLLAWAIDSIGDPFAVHGFASDDRHDVQYYRFKDFEKPCDDDAKARMAGMQGGLSTRMGAALRHVGQHLLQQQSQRKLVLLITDGEPADIDERDPQYLRHQHCCLAIPGFLRESRNSESIDESSKVFFIFEWKRFFHALQRKVRVQCKDLVCLPFGIINCT
jgi:hypothetical protein